MRRSGWIALLGIALAGSIAVLVWSNRNEPTRRDGVGPIVWSVDFEKIDRVAIDLRSLGKRQAWVRGADKGWYFEGPERTRVDERRWGGGIPLLISGPHAQRIIANQASDEQLAVYGLADPQMIVDLAVAGSDPINVQVGGRTPDGSADYVRVGETSTVYTVHHSWKDTLARLVLEPPVARE